MSLTRVAFNSLCVEGFEIIEGRHVVIGFKERPSGVAADEPGLFRHEDLLS